MLFFKSTDAKHHDLGNPFVEGFEYARVTTPREELHRVGLGNLNVGEGAVHSIHWFMHKG